MRNERRWGMSHRRRTAAVLAGLMVAPHALALKIEPKALARFDVTFAPCEARFTEMRGRGDEVFASLWSGKLDANARAQFSAVRKGAAYVSERRRLAQPAPPPSGIEAAAALDKECRSLWAQAHGNSANKP
jgi:hypothetical protein